MEKYEKQIEVRWSDVDQNRHVRHSCYYDYGAHVLIRFFAESGFDSKTISALNIGPIIFKEECSFIRELGPDDSITVNLQKGKMNEDASRWVMHHEIFNSKSEKSAHITLTGAWMDLAARKLTVPPKQLAKALHELPEGQEFAYKK